MDFVGGSRSELAPFPNVFELVRTGHFEAAGEIVIPPVDAFTFNFDFPTLHLPFAVSHLLFALCNHEATIFPELMSFGCIADLTLNDQDHATLGALLSIYFDPVSACNFTFFLICSRAGP